MTLLPSSTLPLDVQDNIRRYVETIARELTLKEILDLMFSGVHIKDKMPEACQPPCIKLRQDKLFRFEFQATYNHVLESSVIALPTVSPTTKCPDVTVIASQYNRRCCVTTQNWVNSL